MKYYINGWRESKSYFMSFHFTEEELDQLHNGETIIKGQNEFRIEEAWA